jgi:hypothetical protein
MGLLPKGQFLVAVSAFAFQAQFIILAFSQIYFIRYIYYIPNLSTTY